MSRAMRIGFTWLLAVLLAPAARAGFSVDQCVDARLPDGRPFQQGRVTEVAGGSVSVRFSNGSGITVPVTWSDGQVLVKACGASAAPPVGNAPDSPAGGAPLGTGARCGNAARACSATHDLQQDQLCAHNQVRRCEGLPDLGWNPAVAASARGWADRLQSEGRMYHGDGTGKRIGNLFVNAGNIASGDTSLEAFAMWTQEEPFYDQLIATHGHCGMSLGDDSMKCGHWANIVNPSSSQLACGMAGRYLVCQLAR